MLPEEQLPFTFLRISHPFLFFIYFTVFETEHFEHYNILTLEIIFFPPHLLNFILHYFSLLLLAVGFSGLFSIAVTFLNYFSKAFIFC